MLADVLGRITDRCKTCMCAFLPERADPITFFRLFSSSSLIFPETMVYYIPSIDHGVLAQLARAPRWQRGGHEFKSHILHH